MIIPQKLLFFRSSFFMLILFFSIFYISLYAQDQPEGKGWILDWSDEFDYQGRPDNSKWALIHYDDEQSHKDLAVVKDGNLMLTIKKMDGRWRAGFVMTGPSVSRHVPAAVNGGHDRKMFAPPENGKCRLEIKFRGINAKGGGPMCSGLHTGMWLYSNDVQLPLLEGTKYEAMRGEIDMIEHTSGPGNKPWIQSIHIHHRYREDGKRKNTRSSQATLTPTGPGELGYWGDTEWHVLAVEWGEDGVYNYMDGQLISKRTSTKAKPTTTEDGREVWGYEMEGLYFAFDEKFPMALYLGSCIWTEPGRLWGGGIGPADGEKTDYDCFPFTMYYDYVRFYTKSN